MREEPLGDALLETAHQVLKDTLIPALPAQHRHAAMMVASAIAIAMRQFRSGASHEVQELAALEALLAGAAPDAPDAPAVQQAVREQLHSRYRELCQRIRHAEPGAPALSPAVHQHLLQAARQTLAESSPKYFR